jgi:hypothetical protein
MLKIIAFSSMAIDHIGVIFFPELIFLRIIGRLALPLFAFGIAEGYLKTRNVFNYGQRILFLALISQPIFFLLFNNDKLNIVFTLLLGLVAIYIYDKNKSWPIKIITILLLLLAATYFKLEYGAYGVLMTLLFFVFKNKASLILWQSSLSFAYVFLNPLYLLQVFSVPAFFLAHYLNKFRFKMPRILSYSFYPGHLLIIYIVYLLLNLPVSK